MVVGAPILSQADVGPPVKIRLVPESAHPAVAGMEYQASFEVLAGAHGTINWITVDGAGWENLEVDAADAINVDAGDVLGFQIAGTPGAADQRVRVQVVFDGRPVIKTFDLSPARFARVGKPGRAVGLDAQGRPGPFQPQTGGQPTSNVAGQSLHLFGRIAYQRPTSPMDGTLITVGVESMWFEVMDEDDISDETIVSGYTDAYGYFDVNVTWDDCDISGCDDPDIYLRWETDNDVVNVQRSDLLEEDYSWSTQDSTIGDFTGSEVNFGTVMPGDPGQYPAMQIHNSIMHAYHYILLNSGTGIDVEEVDVQWPEDETGSGAFYEPFFEEIHIAPSKQWNEDTHTHEYGHHFLENYSVNPEPDYCNGTCDTCSGCPGCFPCVFPFSMTCGHCIWCSETDHDAWNEGWPNWLADVVTRSYPLRYNNYLPYSTRSQEGIQPTCGCTLTDGSTCSQNSQPNDPFRTEGYAGALCRDIDDATQDDHDNLDYDGDGIADDYDGDGFPDCNTDAMSLGPVQIFQVVTLDRPSTAVEFIAAFRARFPQYDQDLWSTVRNVAPEFSFPLPPPTVVSQTQGCESYVEGDTLSLNVQGNGSLLRYQWRRDGINSFDSATVSGSTSPTLVIDPLSGIDTGTYDCVVRTCDGTLSVTSTPVRVHVFPKSGGGTNGGSWGRNNGGQLGRGVYDNGTLPYTAIFPAPIVALSDAVSISPGANSSHKMALRSDGTVWGWGYNNYNQLGRADFSSVLTPIPIPGLQDIVQVAAGPNFSLALTADGRVLGWGDNNWGQLGVRGPLVSPSTPVEIPGIDCVVSVAAGDYHTVAVRSDGTVWAWGLNTFGGLGRGTFGGLYPDPAPVPGISDANSVAAGALHTLVLLNDGTVLAFGWNYAGQLGDGTFTDRASPVVVQNLSGVRAVRAGTQNSFAILQDQTARGWGNNNGTLGTGNFGPATTPVEPFDVGTVLDVASGYSHTVYLRTDRTVWVTGSNQYGELGPRPTPEPFRPLPVSGIHNALAIGAGSETSFVLTSGMGPQIAQRPANQNKSSGQSAMFSVLAFGTATLTYQWTRDGNDLLDGNGVSGANSATLTLNPVSRSMEGTYHVVVQNSFGQMISPPAALYVECAAGDANCDGFIDGADAAELVLCLNGPGGLRPAACPADAFAVLDANRDNAVDLRDAAAFQNAF